MEYTTLGDMLEESSISYPDNISIIHNGKTLTYEKLNGAAKAFGNALKKLGIKKGDKVAIMLPNVPDFIIAYFATVKLGAVAVTINTLSTSYELIHLLSDSESRALITTPLGVKRFQEIRGDCPLCEHLIVTEGDQGDTSIEDVIETGPRDLKAVEISKDDPAVMIYTAGLTGKPLGAVLTHGNLSTQSLLLRDMIHADEHDRGLCLIPLFHSFGAVANMLGILKIGASLVMMDQFKMDSIFKAIEEEKITYIAAVPRLFLGMFIYEGVEGYNLDSLKLCITGGSAAPAEFFDSFEKKFGVRLMEGYGLTEAAPVCSFSRIDMVQKPGSVGIPIPGVEAKVVDENGVRLPAGEEGELLLKGPNIMKGYYRNDAATADVIKDGWLHTGDLAWIDEEGYIFLTGLKKRMIITSGFNVYPKEVEDVLHMHSEVFSAMVVGKPDMMRGETVKAIIIKKEGAEVDEKAIMKHCRIYLSPYKTPRTVEFVESFDGL
ncbi:MAG: AMP-binding protein [Deltaproteobacteria bacterium]|nr:AMP-binding protein [Deltaproteobacteria bacterium]